MILAVAAGGDIADRGTDKVVTAGMIVSGPG
jgi:hypothetical protein